MHTTPTNTLNRSQFIESPVFDFSAVMGGAALTLLLPLLVTVAPAILPLLFWIWVVFFEGSHFWATFSRTYLDRKFASENRRFLFGSLIFFVFPALAVAHSTTTESKIALEVYGFFIFVWSLYHNTRQHYGFLSIYSKKADETPETKLQRTLWLYLAIGIPQFYFMMFHKGPLALSFFPSLEAMGQWGTIMHYSCWALSAGVGLKLISDFFSSTQKNLTQTYSLVCWVFYTVMFYGVAPREPFFSAAQNGAQSLMLLAIMNSLFHNIQYHAIVWTYSKKRYIENTEKVSNDLLGLASRVNGSFTGYATASLIMGAVFALIVNGLADWPNWQGVGPLHEMNALSYVLFFGIIGHHFFLDQMIWRPSHQKDLRHYFRLNA